jgi:pyridinium-3,5-bisthiocarboxylic acid mononucleotide nickel chelatase
MLTHVIMKKGRPGTLLTVLCNPSDSPALERLILSETSTLGIRIRQDRRSCLDRTYTTVSTPYGDIRIKIGSLAGETLNVAPEFEDCRAAAARHHAAVKHVQQAAIAAYLQHSKDPS